jgi:molybdopterin/thiamine biosynthesis adenylyltransferase
MESKLQLVRLLDYGYKILGKFKRIANQDIEEIIIPKDLWDKAEQRLSSSSLETTVFFFGKIKGKKLLVTDVLIPEDDDYEGRSFGHVHVSTKYVIKEFPKLQNQGKTLIATVHSHPMETLSFGDIGTHMNVIKHFPHQLSGVYFNGKVFFYKFEDGIKLTRHRIFETGRFDRQVRIFGEEGQLLISTTSIALIGVGGGNTKIAFDLAGLGIGKLILIDPDRWEEHNRNRVFIPPKHVGTYKVESVRRLIKEYYPNVKVEGFVAKAEDLPEKVYAESDVLVVGPDIFTTRIFGNRMALKLKKPAVFPAAGIEVKDGKLNVMGGSVQVVIPDETPCWECTNQPDWLTIKRETLDEEAKKKLAQKYSLGNLLDVPTTPSIVCLNDVIAGMAIWEVVKLITKIDKPIPFQVYDALNSDIKVVRISKNLNCLACSEVEQIDTSGIEFQGEEKLLSYKGEEKC